MNKEQISGLVRHALTFVGGYLVTKGIIDESTLTDAIGALTTIVGLVWSFIAKRKTV